MYLFTVLLFQYSFMQFQCRVYSTKYLNSRFCCGVIYFVFSSHFRILPLLTWTPILTAVKLQLKLQKKHMTSLTVSGQEWSIMEQRNKLDLALVTQTILIYHIYSLTQQRKLALKNVKKACALIQLCIHSQDATNCTRTHTTHSLQ